uniref:Uncharacterized protein n=1 Tax=Elaeophora elaphi TaxID=1147741 RepID=A0A0R3RP97_9BILA
MYFEKRNEILSNEESSNLEEINADLSKEKMEISSNKRMAGKLREEIENRKDRKMDKTSKIQSFFPGECSRKNFGSRQTTKKISGSRELSKEISDSKKSRKRDRWRYRRSDSKESVKYAIRSRGSGSTERLRDESAEYDKKVYSGQVSLLSVLPFRS